MRTVKKTIFTLNVDGYAPEITALTYPLIEAYAEKIGADLHVISERKFPEWPVTYEKLQIYQLAQEMENDWNIYIDSDTLVHPDTQDLTLLLPRDTVAHFGRDHAPNRWRSDRYFQRDGRNFGTGNWLTVASDLCVDLWRPLDDLTPEQAIDNIFPTVAERRSGVVSRDHLIDDYTLSRNIARFGLKATTFKDIFTNMGYTELKNDQGQIVRAAGGGFFYHHYLYPTAQKVVDLRKVIRHWGITEIMGYDFPDETPVDKASVIAGGMTRAELTWLYETSQDMASVVEVGSLNGRSTFALCSGCSPDKGKVYAVDTWIFRPWMAAPHLELTTYKDGDSFFAEFLKNCGHFPHLTAVKKLSVEAAASDKVPAEVDMVFIDAGHDYKSVLEDLKAWAPRAKKIVCGHDLDDPVCPDVRTALNEYFGAGKFEKGPDTIWMVKV